MFKSRLLCAMLLWAGVTSASAAVIDFSNLPSFTNYDPVPASYGSTPQVAVSYRSFTNSPGTPPPNELLLWNAGYSNLPAAAFASSNNLGAEITLTPMSGFSVLLQSFQLGSYLALPPLFIGPNRTTGILRVIEVGTGNVLWDQTGLVVNSAQTLTPGVTSANGLSLQWGYDWNIGLNNLTFQARATGTPSVIPVPPAIALFLGGAALLGWTSRRRT